MPRSLNGYNQQAGVGCFLDKNTDWQQTFKYMCRLSPGALSEPQRALESTQTASIAANIGPAQPRNAAAIHTNHSADDETTDPRG